MSRRSLVALFCAAVCTTACVSPTDYNQQVQKTRTYEQLDAQLKTELAGDQAQIEQLQNLVRLTLAGVKVEAAGAEQEQMA